MSREDTPTAHIAAQYDDIAKTVIMCGDPLRAKFIAEKYLEDPKLFNEVRGMLGRQARVGNGSRYGYPLYWYLLL